MTEFELKFEVPSGNLASVVAAMRQCKTAKLRLQASYFDTADGALARRGIVLRLRKEGRRWVQTAKAPTADLFERLEQSIDLPLQPAGAVPLLELWRHRASPVGKAIDAALGRTADGNCPSLDLLYGTDIQRITTRVACQASVVEVALDQGRVFGSGKSQSICELEVELKEGSPHDAVAVAQQWCAAHGLWISTIAKSVKGQRLRGAAPVGGGAALVAATAPKLTLAFGRRSHGEAVTRAVVAACLAQILPNMSELANGSEQPEQIHKLRVGLRRLRTVLREFDGITNGFDPAWEPVLTRVFGALGAHRDQTLLALLQSPMLAAGGPALRFDEASCKLLDLGSMLRAPNVQKVLLGLLAFVHRDLPVKSATPAVVKKVILQHVQKLHTRALRDGKNFMALDEVRQHGVRKRFKRLRYLLDFAAPLFAARKLGQMTALLKPVQDVLGLYNDELMALRAWQAKAADNPNAWFGVGWLSARKQPNAKRCLKEIKLFARVKPFWHD